MNLMFPEPHFTHQVQFIVIRVSLCCIALAADNSMAVRCYISAETLEIVKTANCTKDSIQITIAERVHLTPCQIVVVSLSVLVSRCNTQLSIKLDYKLHCITS